MSMAEILRDFFDVTVKYFVIFSGHKQKLNGILRAEANRTRRAD